jgi:hypothetical protein
VAGQRGELGSLVLHLPDQPDDPPHHQQEQQHRGGADGEPVDPAAREQGLGDQQDRGDERGGGEQREPPP